MKHFLISLILLLALPAAAHAYTSVPQPGVYCDSYSAQCVEVTSDWFHKVDSLTTTESLYQNPATGQIRTSRNDASWVRITGGRLNVSYTYTAPLSRFWSRQVRVANFATWGTTDTNLLNRISVVVELIPAHEAPWCPDYSDDSGRIYRETGHPAFMHDDALLAEHCGHLYQQPEQAQPDETQPAAETEPARVLTRRCGSLRARAAYTVTSRQRTCAVARGVVRSFVATGKRRGWRCMGNQRVTCRSGQAIVTAIKRR